MSISHVLLLCGGHWGEEGWMAGPAAPWRFRLMGAGGKEYECESPKVRACA